MSDEKIPPNSSSPVEKRSRLKSFDRVIKKYMFAVQSEKVAAEVKEILEEFVTGAFNDSSIWLTHPQIIKTTLSLMIDDLSETDSRIFHDGLRTTLSAGIDPSIFDGMDNEPFFDFEIEEDSTEPAINLNEIKQLADFIERQGYSEFSFENEKFRISLKKIKQEA